MNGATKNPMNWNPLTRKRRLERLGEPGALRTTAHEIDRMPSDGSSARKVYRRIRRELSADGNPEQNLASFVTTRMDRHAGRLATECIGKNLINSAEYPQTEQIHQRIIRMTADLFHAGHSEETGFIGTTTIGSSEAIMLGLLAHKWNWRNRHRQTPQASPKDQPYLVIGTHAHACFTKFARYFDVAVKWIPLAPGQLSIGTEQVRAVIEKRISDDPQVMKECGFTKEEAGERKVGELVMAIGCVLGSTYSGALDDVAGIDRILTEGNWDIPIHVDAASGGFVLPFTQPSLEWDFRLPHVQSINVSNHKYGLVHAGLGTLVFRHSRIVPDDLLVDVPYLSGEMRSFSLNFSRPANSVAMQYHAFLTLGKAGYRRVMLECLATAGFVADRLAGMPQTRQHFELVSNPDEMPVVAFRLQRTSGSLTLDALAEALKRKGWIVPVYRLPADVEEVEVMRVVVKPEFTRVQAKSFLRDLAAAVSELTAVAPRTAAAQALDVFRNVYATAGQTTETDGAC